MVGGSGVLWMVGGLSTIVLVPTIVASAMGLVINQPRRAASAPTPPVDDMMEQQLIDRGYGDNAVQKYRQRREAGVQRQLAARDAIYMVLQTRRCTNSTVSEHFVLQSKKQINS